MPVPKGSKPGPDFARLQGHINATGLQKDNPSAFQVFSELGDAARIFQGFIEQKYPTLTGDLADLYTFTQSIIAELQDRNNTQYSVSLVNSYPIPIPHGIEKVLFYDTIIFDDGLMVVQNQFGVNNSIVANRNAQYCIVINNEFCTGSGVTTLYLNQLPLIATKTGKLTYLVELLRNDVINVTIKGLTASSTVVPVFQMFRVSYGDAHNNASGRTGIVENQAALLCAVSSTTGKLLAGLGVAGVPNRDLVAIFYTKDGIKLGEIDRSATDDVFDQGAIQVSIEDNRIYIVAARNTNVCSINEPFVFVFDGDGTLITPICVSDDTVGQTGCGGIYTIYVPEPGKLWVGIEQDGNSGNPSLFEYTSDGEFVRKVLEFVTGGNALIPAYGMYRRNGFVFINSLSTSAGGPGLFKFDLATGTPSVFVALANQANAMCGSGDSIFITDNAGASVLEYDMTGTLINTFTTPSGFLLGLAVNQKYIYVGGDGFSLIYRINRATGQITAFNDISSPESGAWEVDSAMCTICDFEPCVEGDNDSISNHGGGATCEHCVESEVTVNVPGFFQTILDTAGATKCANESLMASMESDLNTAGYSVETTTGGDKRARVYLGFPVPDFGKFVDLIGPNCEWAWLQHGF